MQENSSVRPADPRESIVTPAQQLSAGNATTAASPRINAIRAAPLNRTSAIQVPSPHRVAIPVRLPEENATAAALPSPARRATAGGPRRGAAMAVHRIKDNVLPGLRQPLNQISPWGGGFKIRTGKENDYRFENRDQTRGRTRTDRSKIGTPVSLTLCPYNQIRGCGC